MKKTKANRSTPFVFHISKPLNGYGLPRKQKIKVKSVAKRKK